MKRLFALCLLAALACGESDSPFDIPDDMGFIRIWNRSAIAVIEVNISRCESAEWGPNRLPGPIEPGKSQYFQIAPNCYDVRAIGTTSHEVHFFDLALTRGSVLTLEIVDG